MNNNDITNASRTAGNENAGGYSSDAPDSTARNGDTDPELDKDITIENLQSTVDRWITGIGNGYFSPLTNMAILAEETGEVARQMSRIYGDQSFKAGEAPNLADELADVLWVVAAIANQTGVDLTDALRHNLRKKTLRDRNRHNRPA